MSREKELLKELCYGIRNRVPHHIPSNSRRGAVVAIIRWSGAFNTSTPAHTLEEYFEKLGEGQAEVLFMKRASREGDRWSGHVAFPGGKDEPGESDLETACREVWEEIGLDLNSPDYIPLGQLDEREVSSIRENRLLMVLVPFGIANIPTFQIADFGSSRRAPLDLFLSQQSFNYHPITNSLSFVRQKRSPWVQKIFNLYLGTITFPSVDIPCESDSTQFRLWGLTMRMVKDIVSHVKTPSYFYKLASASPQFSRWDIGWFAHLITVVKIYRHPKSDWDNIYWKSVRWAILLSVVFRTSLLVIIYKICARMN
ncbi:hypothetical protein BY458DRAFT_560571 [Sporodiniella umbellata]|nr:hypothetical protein BY458DRAFT_560571 [Sporodiniella umbellata]